LDSFSAVAGSEVLDGPVEELEVQAARSPVNVAAVALVLVVLVLVGLVVLGTQYDESAVWRDRVSTWWGGFSTAQPPIENRSSIPRISEAPEIQFPTDSSLEKAALDSIPELETQPTVEPGFPATETEESSELEADLPVQEEQGADLHSNPEWIPEETGSLPDEVSLDNPVQDTATNLADIGFSQPEGSIQSEGPVQASVLATTAASLEEEGADDSTAAKIVAATEHVMHVEFGFDSAEFSNESQGVLERALELMNSAQGSRALISGYSDNLGAEQYNLSLSRRRAETVARYLADNGIQRTRLQVEGLGAIQVSANTGEQELLPGYNEWRIVEIRISLPGQP
jgi:outer membrane protein OmpA-like peptidoglycan-associated protein